MYTVERATAADFERVYPHLRESFGEEIPKEEWRKIFVRQWDAPEEFCGLMLLREGEVRGYLGLLFSERALGGGRRAKLCNMTSWCVSEDSRGQSLSLLLEALKLKEYTFTNFTASETVAAVLARLRFQQFAVHQQVILPVPSLGLGRRGVACRFNHDEIRRGLDEDDRRVFDDHQHFGCEHLLFESARGYSYVVLKKTWRKRLPFAKAHYLSDAGAFAEGVGGWAARVCRRLGVAGLMVDERYLGGRRLSFAARYPHQRLGYFKPGADAPPAERIDTLYSELVVLHS